MKGGNPSAKGSGVFQAHTTETVVGIWECLKHSLFDFSCNWLLAYCQGLQGLGAASTGWEVMLKATVLSLVWLGIPCLWRIHAL